jgi:putative protease
LIDYNRLELLAPAGDSERFNAALDYGADAVYLGAQSFGMRAGPANFTFDLLKEACEKAHSRNVKIYLTCNTLPRNSEISGFREFIEAAASCGIDAAIVTDIGLLSLIKKYAPKLEIHISTQAGIVNYAAANEFYNMGAKRVVLARELSLDEIAEIRAKTPIELDIEAFVHGAMCMSFSGRCLLSNYMVNRDANRGECAQPCRWGYYLMEEKRPNEFFKIEETEQGTYILNAKDLSMLEHIDKIAKAGVTSFKIEGRAKSAYYVSVVTNAYRIAMDILKENQNSFELPQWVKDEVFKVSHRQYCTGFYFGNPKDCQYYENSGYIREYDIVGVASCCKGGMLYGQQRNKFLAGDELEILSPKVKPTIVKADVIFNEAGESVESACHAMMNFSFPCQHDFPENSIIRKKKQP